MCLKCLILYVLNECTSRCSGYILAKHNCEGDRLNMDASETSSGNFKIPNLIHAGIWIIVNIIFRIVYISSDLRSCYNSSIEIDKIERISKTSQMDPISTSSPLIVHLFSGNVRLKNVLNRKEKKPLNTWELNSANKKLEKMMTKIKALVSVMSKHSIVLWRIRSSRVDMNKIEGQ